MCKRTISAIIDLTNDETPKRLFTPKSPTYAPKSPTYAPKKNLTDQLDALHAHALKAYMRGDEDTAFTTADELMALNIDAFEGLARNFYKFCIDSNEVDNFNNLMLQDMSIDMTPIVEYSIEKLGKKNAFIKCMKQFYTITIEAGKVTCERHD